MIENISHIGIAVRSLEEAINFYQNILGLKLLRKLTITERKIRIAEIEAGNEILELIEPMDVDTPVAKFLEKRGEGLHHIAFRVADIDRAINELKKKGIELVTEEAQIGAHGRKIVFLSPVSCHGVLIELCEENLK